MNKLKTEFYDLMWRMTDLQLAEMVLPIWEAEYPQDKRPRQAIEADKVGELTDEIMDNIKELRRDVYAAIVCRDKVPPAYFAGDAIGLAVVGFAAVVRRSAIRAFALTTDDLKKKVIETGNDILKRDEEIKR